MLPREVQLALVKLKKNGLVPQTSAQVTQASAIAQLVKAFSTGVNSDLPTLPSF